MDCLIVVSLYVTVTCTNRLILGTCGWRCAHSLVCLKSLKQHRHKVKYTDMYTLPTVFWSLRYVSTKILHNLDEQEVLHDFTMEKTKLDESGVNYFVTDVVWLEIPQYLLWLSHFPETPLRLWLNDIPF